MLKHVIFKDFQLNGWEYGMLRSFEAAISTVTGAEAHPIPPYLFLRDHIHRLGYGMNKSWLRKYIPKTPFAPQADIGWCILMGPENYKLDLFKDWTKSVKTKILYIYDTMPSQYPVIKQILATDVWDVLITSFNDAVPDLEKRTNRKWHCISQAADRSLFKRIPLEERFIHFSSYGRRLDRVHDIVKDFCKTNNLYYDYTTHDGKHPMADATDLYKQYAWHISHSVFTFSWPVEVTNPKRCAPLRPITCRWFEAAGASTLILGEKPDNPSFDKLLPNGLVNSIQYLETDRVIYEQIEGLWNNREVLHNKLNESLMNFHNNIYWEDRVEEILKLI
ncbi:MAG: glycosyltransferase family 1 protein [Bacteroidota bacterium]|nr:glycosyltransferase family 1 protein [Bacteroidota bacterium]